MPRFEVFLGSTLVGHSDLELGDAPMGVAFGRFVPNSAYRAFQPTVVAACNGPQDHLLLEVRLAGGDALPAQGGVQLMDASAEFGSEGMEVSVLGIGYPLYEELFPQHVAAYDAQFPKAD